MAIKINASRRRIRSMMSILRWLPLAGRSIFYWKARALTKMLPIRASNAPSRSASMWRVCIRLRFLDTRLPCPARLASPASSPWEGRLPPYETNDEGWHFRARNGGVRPGGKLDGKTDRRQLQARPEFLFAKQLRAHPLDEGIRHSDGGREGIPVGQCRQYESGGGPETRSH